MAEQSTGAPRGGRRGKKMRAMAYPVFGVLMNAWVVSKSMKAVGHLRHKYQIKPPSTEPNDDMNDEEKALWYRTYRAQINSIEWFSITTPVFIGGALVGKHAFGCFGKYVPYVMGTCAIFNAYLRNGYLKAYQKDVDTRTWWFKKTTTILKLSFGVAVVSCVSIMYQDAKCLVKKYKK